MKVKQMISLMKVYKLTEDFKQKTPLWLDFNFIHDSLNAKTYNLTSHIFKFMDNNGKYMKWNDYHVTMSIYI